MRLIKNFCTLYLHEGGVIIGCLMIIAKSIIILGYAIQHLEELFFGNINEKNALTHTNHLIRFLQYDQKVLMIFLVFGIITAGCLVRGSIKFNKYLIIPEICSEILTILIYLHIWINSSKFYDHNFFYHIVCSLFLGRFFIFLIK